MSLVGIVDNEKKVNELKREMKNKINNLEIISINPKSIKNLSKIKFETIVINKEIENKIISEFLKKAKYLILNSDLKIDELIFEEIDIKTITYGMNQKSTITASSISNETIVISVQREIEGLENNIIEPQEVNIKNDNKNIYEILMKYALIKVYNG